MPENWSILYACETVFHHPLPIRCRDGHLNCTLSGKRDNVAKEGNKGFYKNYSASEPKLSTFPFHQGKSGFDTSRNIKKCIQIYKVCETISYYNCYVEMQRGARIMLKCVSNAKLCNNNLELTHFAKKCAKSMANYARNNRVIKLLIFLVSIIDWVVM